MKKRLPVLFLAAALTFGLAFGGFALAQPPQPGGQFPANHLPKPDMKGPDGKNFNSPDGKRPGQEMRDNFRHDKKDFQNRVEHERKDFKDKIKQDKRIDKRGEGKEFRPGEHRDRPDFGKADHNQRPGTHRGAPDFGQTRQ